VVAIVKRDKAGPVACKKRRSVRDALRIEEDIIDAVSKPVGDRPLAPVPSMSA
jgi:hypothetical protein